MTNPIHKFLDKKYETHELVLFLMIIIGVGGLLSYFFGKWSGRFFGMIFIAVGVYGFIREYRKEKIKKN